MVGRLRRIPRAGRRHHDLRLFCGATASPLARRSLSAWRRLRIFARLQLARHSRAGSRRGDCPGGISCSDAAHAIRLFLVCGLRDFVRGLLRTDDGLPERTADARSRRGVVSLRVGHPYSWNVTHTPLGSIAPNSFVPQGLVCSEPLGCTLPPRRWYSAYIASIPLTARRTMVWSPTFRASALSSIPAMCRNASPRLIPA